MDLAGNLIVPQRGFNIFYYKAHRRRHVGKELGYEALRYALSPASHSYPLQRPRCCDIVARRRPVWCYRSKACEETDEKMSVLPLLL